MPSVEICSRIHVCWTAELQATLLLLTVQQACSCSGLGVTPPKVLWGKATLSWLLLPVPFQEQVWESRSLKEALIPRPSVRTPWGRALVAVAFPLSLSFLGLVFLQCWCQDCRNRGTQWHTRCHDMVGLENQWTTSVYFVLSTFGF